MTRPVHRVGVVVPAHDEERRIGDCLAALATASNRVDVPVRIVVVLDDCTDRTAAVCAGSGVDTVHIAARSVGRARHVGALALLAGEPDPATVWLANTDADTIIPPDWLVDQVGLADGGADAVAGTVALPRRGSGDAVAAAFAAHYGRRLGPDGSHGHVHGANLGVRASAYLRVGGFPPLRAHEDRWLLQRLDADEAVTVVRSAKIVVQTSARLAGRCPDGFAATLLRLRSAPAPAA